MNHFTITNCVLKDISVKGFENVLKIFLRLIRLLTPHFSLQTFVSRLLTLCYAVALFKKFWSISGHQNSWNICQKQTKALLIHQNYQSFYVFVNESTVTVLLLWYMEIDNREIDFVKWNKTQIFLPADDVTPCRNKGVFTCLLNALSKKPRFPTWTNLYKSTLISTKTPQLYLTVSIKKEFLKRILRYFFARNKSFSWRPT